MLPLLNEFHNSPAMVWHGIKISTRPSITRASINLGQATVTKSINPYSCWLRNCSGSIHRQSIEKTPHTERMLCGMSGDCLDGSDWITALTNSGISTSGIAQSFTSIHHICRTRCMQQVSVAALHMLMIIMLIKQQIFYGDLVTLLYDVQLQQWCVLQPDADY